MYIESMNSQAAVNTQTATPASTVRPVTKADTDNAVRVETTDGEHTRAQDNASANSTVSGYQNKDTRTVEEKRSAENEKIKKAIEKMNVQLPNSELKFGIHEKPTE